MRHTAAVPALIAWWTRDLAVLAPDADPEAVATVGADLLRRWTEPHRRYHGTQHLVEVFWALEDLTDAGEVSEPDAVLARVAGWLHDAVYDPAAPPGANEAAAPPGANEAASAELARDRLTELGLDPADVRTVDDLVRMTADHGAADGDAVQRAFHDADLWILAADEARFDEYCAQVRDEYASVPDAVFRPARFAILTGLVGGDGLYLTPFARREWEGPARANLARELARLG